MTSKEALEIWAKRKLDDEGVPYSEGDTITVQDETFDDGYCETCSWPYEALTIRLNGKRVYKGYEEISGILDELIAIASEDMK